MSKTSEFRKKFFSNELTLAMEAYNGLSAKIIEEAGFECVWASGLSSSASMNLRDCDELTATQMIQLVDYMIDATNLPVLVDGDTGYGDFNNARRFVRQISKIGAVGLTIEDMKVKSSSYSGQKTPADLEDIDLFCGKIKAAKDAQLDPDFIVIGRIHALICGTNMNEAIERAVAVKEAGADAVFFHSKLANASEIIEFADVWHNKYKFSSCPIVISPVSYFATPMEDFKKAKIACMIIAGYNIRACIKAMREVCGKIKSGTPLVEIEKQVAPLKDIFTLVNNDELLTAERIYGKKK